MKKNLFFVLLSLMTCAFAMSAGNVRIMVDNPANVSVTTQSGYGRTLDLGNGNEVFTDLTESDAPLLITANQGAAIESVKVNDKTITPSGDGKYRVGIETSGMLIDITTSGSAQDPGQTKRSVPMSAVGQGVTGTPFTITYQNASSEWVSPETSSMGMMEIPEDATVKVSPTEPYLIAGLTMRNGNAIETTALDDGSVTFVCSYDKFYYQTIYVNLTERPDAIHFSITVDYAPNLSAVLENQRDGRPYRWLNLNNGTNNFACLPTNTPLEFMATEGAQILTVTRNGEPFAPIGMNGAGGYVVEPLEEGDAFVITTKGKPVDVSLEVDENQAPLQSYLFTDSQGNTFPAEGMAYTLSTTNGETIYVSPRPGTTLTFMYTSNGGTTDTSSYFRAAPGANGTDPMKVNIMGERTVTGVVINVDAADRIQIIQEGGRGDKLTLKDGKNEFALADLKNALAVSSTEGNQMVSVSQNGTSLAATAQGVYPVVVEEGDWIDIVSRRNPVDVALKFNFGETGDVTWLKAIVDGVPVTLTSPLTVKTYAEIVVSAAEGYSLNGITAVGEGVSVQRIPDTDSYAITVTDANITDAEVNVAISEITPEAGKAVVIPNGEEIFITYREWVKGEDGNYTFVSKLTNNTINQVTIGNYVEVYCKDSQSRFRYVRANGVDVPLEAGKDDRQAYVKIDGRTVIETEIYTPCYAYVEGDIDDTKNIPSGKAYFLVEGNKVSSLYVEAGQTVKLTAEAEPGYLFDHYERFYPHDVTGFVIEGDEYTFTAQDVATEIVLIKGFFKVNPEEKSYVVRGSTAWLVDETGNVVNDPETSSAMGTVVFQNHAGEYVAEYTGIEGDEIGLFVSSPDQSIFENYEVWCYCFMEGFPNNKIQGIKYTIKADDANSEGVIWINALIRAKQTSVEGIESTEEFGYDAASATVHAPAAVEVYDLNGRLLLSGNGSLSVETLSSGIYVAKSNGKTLKFVR